MVSAPILSVWWTFPQQRPRRVLSPSFQSTVELSPSSSSPSKIRRTDSPQSFSRQKRRLKSKWFFCTTNLTNTRRIAIMSPKLGLSSWAMVVMISSQRATSKAPEPVPYLAPSFEVLRGLYSPFYPMLQVKVCLHLSDKKCSFDLLKVFFAIRHSLNLQS